MSDPVRVILTFPPPTHPLSENEKRRMKHWAQWRRRLDPWAEAVQWAWRAAPKGQRSAVQRMATATGVSIFVELPFAKNARRDPHNYVGTNVKVIIDALTRVDAWPDDNPQYVSVLEPACVVGLEDVRVHITSRGTE